ncbi:MAG TPA: hypothetical protein EYN03_05260, partial [Planctomycetes bacterium]|nr:hypothetical protein [Planctomycetota bacterium]
SCYRGFHSEPGAEGVGRAATAAFVYSYLLMFVSGSLETAGHQLDR